MRDFIVPTFQFVSKKGFAVTNVEEEFYPDDQQESEDDLRGKISFKDSVVMSTDWTIETINSQIQKKNIDLDPDFQRRGAWDDIRKSRLIESIIAGMPIPNIVLAENKLARGKFIVIDGKQRLLSINEFMEDKLVLKGLDIRPELNGLSFKTLSSDDRQFLENSTLRSTIIKNWHDESFLYAIFFRLNSGSLPLSPQELRKALIGGKLLDEIESYITKSAAFHAVFGEQLDRRMRDSELVLRFIAFDKSFENYDGNLKLFLDETTRYYESNWSANVGELGDRLGSLDRALKTTVAIFGSDSFKKWAGGNYERRINRAVFDCIARFLSDDAVASKALADPGSVVEAFKATCGDARFREAVEKTTKSVKATQARIAIWGKSLGAVLGMSYDAKSARLS